MGHIEDRLAGLGLTLRPPKAPVANYLGAKRAGRTLHVSARVSEARGLVGQDLDLDQAKLAARDTAVLLLSIVKHAIGDLDHIESVDFVRGFVRSAPGFDKQPLVIDGASDLLVELFGEAGRHARTATGTSALPFGAAIQLDMVLTLLDESNGS